MLVRLDKPEFLTLSPAYYLLPFHLRAALMFYLFPMTRCCKLCSMANDGKWESGEPAL